MTMGKIKRDPKAAVIAIDQYKTGIGEDMNDAMKDIF